MDEITEGCDDRLALVRQLILKLAGELKNETSKSGVTELARLIALEKELADSTESVREVKVTWVEPDPVDCSKSE